MVVKRFYAADMHRECDVKPKAVQWQKLTCELLFGDKSSITCKKLDKAVSERSLLDQPRAYPEFLWSD